jgi:hypothetical protein
MGIHPSALSFAEEERNFNKDKSIWENELWSYLDEVDYILWSITEETHGSIFRERPFF